MLVTVRYKLMVDTWKLSRFVWNSEYLPYHYVLVEREGIKDFCAFEIKIMTKRSITVLCLKSIEQFPWHILLLIEFYSIYIHLFIWSVDFLCDHWISYIPNGNKQKFLYWICANFCYFYHLYSFFVLTRNMSSEPKLRAIVSSFNVWQKISDIPC